MEKLDKVNSVEFHDGFVVMLTDQGAHTARWENGEWMHSFANKETGIFAGQVPSEQHAGMVTGEILAPPRVSPVGDVWFDLAAIRDLTLEPSFHFEFAVDWDTVSKLAQIMWEALAMCALTDAVEDGKTSNPAALVPWVALDARSKGNYETAALEYLLFLSTAARFKVSLQFADFEPKWRKHFPMEMPASPGHEAHMLHGVVTCPSASRA